MVGLSESLLILIVLVIVFCPTVVALIAMRRNGRGWAKARLISYSVVAVMYGLNGVVLFSKGNRIGGWISALIAWFAGKGALAVWRAWKARDYRPAHLRGQAPPLAPDIVSTEDRGAPKRLM
jgi:hypothetical protein